ncbi:hypothetical protein CYY_001320 [Polysphondylium violaceum]|uniref:TPR repeat-containing protein n=1 Tax=Polysphondylium violaceum TaxID=133409 RepID=A0A8J4Q282_9MYCE|nr:hypothetical protein CYY_001320 [Polysphondylium violaceum]
MVIIKDNTPKLNLKYVWLIKVKPKINRFFVVIFQSCNNCFKNRESNKIRHREKERSRKKKKGCGCFKRHDEMEEFEQQLEEINNGTKIFDDPYTHTPKQGTDIPSSSSSTKKRKSKRGSQMIAYNTNYNNNNYNYNNNSNASISIPIIPATAGGGITKEVAKDSDEYLKELKKIETLYENESKNNSLPTIDTCHQYAKRLSSSQDKDNREKSINLLLELLKRDPDKKETYNLDLSTTYYKQGDFRNTLIFADKILQSSPLNMEAMTLKYLSL